MTSTTGAPAATMRFLRFNAVGVAGIFVQLATIWLLVDIVHLHHTLATAAAVTAAVVHNFTWHRQWTWKDRGSRHAPVMKTFTAFLMANGFVSLVGNIAITAVLVTMTPLHAVEANIVAIAACGVLNFWIADVLVFRRTPAFGAPDLQVRGAAASEPRAFRPEVRRISDPVLSPAAPTSGRHAKREWLA